MRFQNDPITAFQIFFALLLYAVGGVLIYVGSLAWSGWNLVSIVAMVAFSGLAYIFISGAWVGSVHLTVDLSNSPREAICRRKNAITRIATRHRYKIPDNGKVFIQTSVAGKYGGAIWPVRITGLPSYYDFFWLGHCRRDNVNDAYAIARTLAGYLGLPMLDHHGATRKIENEGPYVWYPPAPDGHRGRRRRRRS